MKRKFDETNNQTELKDDKCPICLEKMADKNVTITKCGHKFCHTCLDSHSCTDSKCPLCRKDMETKTKVKTLCHCDIQESVTKAIYDSNPYLINLCKRITKKILNTCALHELDDKEFQEDQDIDDIRKILVEKLQDDSRFKIQINQFLYEEICDFTMVNSDHACFHLKSIFESM